MSTFANSEDPDEMQHRNIHDNITISFESLKI